MFDFAKAKAYYNRMPEQFDLWCGIDTESTGVTHRHGSKPFMVAATYSSGVSKLWTAPVDPLTREPKWAQKDLDEILELVSQRHIRFAMSNKKFDTYMLRAILPASWDAEDFLCRTDDTIGMHHAVNNLDSHALKDAAVKYADIPDSDESELHSETRKLAPICRQLGWKLASKETCHVRKAPGKGWAVMDMWVPEAYARYMWETSPAKSTLDLLLAESKRFSITGHYALTYSELPIQYQLNIQNHEGWEWHPPEVNSEDVHKYYTLCAKYCRTDTLRTVILAQLFHRVLLKDNLWEQYLEGNVNNQSAWRIENNGVTYNHTQAKIDLIYFNAAAKNAANAASYAISPIFPINIGSPDQLRNILYGKGENNFGLKVERYTKNKKKQNSRWGDSGGGKPTTDKDYLSDLVQKSKPEDIRELDPPSFTPETTPYRDYLKQLRAWNKKLNDEPDEIQRKINKLFAFCCGVLRYKKAQNSISQINNFEFNKLPYEPPELRGNTLGRNRLASLNSAACPAATVGSLVSDFRVLHQSINPYGTNTGRQAHSNPNGGNISKGGKDKKSIEFLRNSKVTLRHLFGPAPGREWWNFDYTQLQLVIFAVMSGDDLLLNAIANGIDFHDNMARLIFGLPTDPRHPDFDKLAPTSSQRTIAKGVNFGFIFGAQESKLNQSSGMPGLYDRLCNTIPVAVKFLEETEWEVRSKGYVFTRGGYRLYVPEETPYAGVNYKVQGTEAEIAKRAMYGLHYYLDTEICDRNKLFITLPVHDELDFDAELGTGHMYCGRIASIMEDAASSYGIPAKVGCKYITTNWSEGEEIEFEPVPVLSI